MFSQKEEIKKMYRHFGGNQQSEAIKNLPLQATTQTHPYPQEKKKATRGALSAELNKEIRLVILYDERGRKRNSEEHRQSADENRGE